MIRARDEMALQICGMYVARAQKSKSFPDAGVGTSGWRLQVDSSGSLPRNVLCH